MEKSFCYRRCANAHIVCSLNLQFKKYERSSDF